MRVFSLFPYLSAPAALLMAMSLATPMPSHANEASSTGKWQLQGDAIPGTQRHQHVKIVLPAESDFVGWPDDRRERPDMVVECNRGKLRVFVVTKLRPEVYGDYYDDYIAMARVGFGKNEPTKFRMRRDVSGELVHFPRAKSVVRELILHESMFFEFTPFSSAPTSTTFDLSGLQHAIKPLTHRCKI